MSNRPTPSVYRKLSGSNLHRLNKREPRYRRVNIENIPIWLDEAGKTEWNRLGPELIENGTLNSGSVYIFAAYCQSLSQLQAAEMYIAEKSYFIEDPIVSRKTGEIIAYKTMTNPAVAVSNEAKRQIRAFAVEFGITPASAAKVAAPNVGAETKNSFSGFMSAPADDEEEVSSAGDGQLTN